MDNNDLGRVASDQALALRAKPASGLDAPRFDPSREACRDCLYWPARRDRYGSYGLHGHHTDGSVSDCRRGSPRAVRLDREHFAANAVWPRTNANDWCGEFASAIETRSAETGTGSVRQDESAVGEAETPMTNRHILTEEQQP